MFVFVFGAFLCVGVFFGGGVFFLLLFFSIWKQGHWRAFSVPSEVENNSMESERAIQQPICVRSWVSLRMNGSGTKHAGSGANGNSNQESEFSKKH